MILKFGEFILEGKNSEYLSFYAFDWDDNILNMLSVIHMEKKQGDSWIPVDVSTAEFTNVRNDKDNYRILNNNPEDAFSEFRDSGPRGSDAFMIDVEKSISLKRFGPAWNDFIECLTNGCLFAIITARGHESNTLKKGVEYIIDNILTDDQKSEMYSNLLKFLHMFNEIDPNLDRILKGVPSKNPVVINYLSLCDFVGVSAPSRGGSPSNPEKSKEEALLIFKDKINRYALSVGKKAKIGFSDDDVKNVKHIEDLIKNLKKERFPNIEVFLVKNTKDPNNITKSIRNMSENNPQGSGLESSVLPFTQFGNMTNTLYPSDAIDRQYDFKNRQIKHVKYLTKDSKKRKKKSS
jgi:hypothetical protein